ncbi:exosome complex component RRP45A-like [Typha latifolia]|uniref:exosome complex component RRP45A-like n=1 Tax=Typha latifolia TaxID=4733 RepID=UPI003C2D2262
MEHRSSSWRMSVNEKKFIEEAILADLRVDGRRPFDFRRLTIKFGREDGSSEVQLGETHVMGYVTAQLVQPYRDRPNEGTLSIYIEFSPMADPSFEAGRPGESAIEVGRVIDRGLRESRAVDMESLCVVAGKSVWAIRLDLHILDNGGNLIDAANIAALAALLTFQRPECTVGGENSQEVIVHDPEVKEPLPLTIHHLPVAVTFAFFGEGSYMVIDPTFKEEAAMCGKMTATMNSNGDVCAIQKAGEEGVLSSVIMQCLRIASVKATDITSKIRTAVDSYNTERALLKVKRHTSVVAHKVSVPEVVMKESKDDTLTRDQTQILEERMERSCTTEDHQRTETSSSSIEENKSMSSFVGGTSNWDPYSKGVSVDFIRSSQSSPGPVTTKKEQNEERPIQPPSILNCEPTSMASSGLVETSDMRHASPPKSLRDAVKPKNRKKSKVTRDIS